MKRLNVILMACLLVLGMSQCKKEQTNENNNTDEGEKVTITLNVDNGFSKGHVTPGQNTAPVVYDNEDKIMVGYNGAYVGFLTYNGTVFTGSLSISQSDDSQPLHFYYLGGLSWTVTNNQCTVDISDQSSRLGIISYGTSTDDFVGEGTYSATLRNQCGLVKFNTTDVPGAITISGVNNQMTVNFANQTFTPGNSGDVTLNGTSGTTRWAILLPGSGTTVTASTGYSAVSGISIPDIANNAYITGIDINL